MKSKTSLRDYSTDELKEEIRRRELFNFEPSPAGMCHNCGEKWYYHSMGNRGFAAAFEFQKKQFDEAHKDCVPIFSGGSI